MIEHDIKHTAWIYWPKHPRQVEILLDEIINNPPNKCYETIFIGNCVTEKQLKHRQNVEYLESFIDKCIIHTVSDSQELLYTDYLQEISKSEFGICLTGNHIKSTRLMEYMALGIIPVVSQDINTSSFGVPLEENKHFIRFKNIENISQLINNTSPQERTSMSTECKNWYYQNIHSDNSYKNLLESIFFESS